MTRFIALIVAIALTTAGNAQEQIARLTALDPEPNDEFGTSVSISGETAIVGARRDDFSCPDDCNRGSAYIFRGLNDVWMQIAKVVASDGMPGDFFGESISISVDTAVVGACGADAPESNSGAAYVFREIDGAWQEIAKLTASDGAAADLFGWSVAITGTTAVIGAWRDDDAGFDTGSAYVFQEVDGVWQEVAKLTADDGEAGDAFGACVAISGDTIVIGAASDSDFDAGLVFHGSAYVFEEVADGVWQQTAKLTPDDVASSGFFGRCVSIDGDTAVIGAGATIDDSGSAYVFRRPGSVWHQIAKLTPGHDFPYSGFGATVSISGDTVVVGERSGGQQGPHGVAYVFNEIRNSWRPAALIAAEDGEIGDAFGFAVSIDGDTVVVGARHDDGAMGSAYVSRVLDTDGDGLLDDWETLGVPYRDENGDPQRYMLDNANPMHKDLFVEVDELAGFPMDLAAASDVQSAFAAAPVDNPDGEEGVTLHIAVDDFEIELPEPWPLGPDVWPSDYETVRAAWYGTDSERQQAMDGSTILQERVRAVRYCILAGTTDDGTLGIAEDIPSDDFIVYMGEEAHTDGNHDTDDIAGTWMHELGHCLGLGHGGCDDELGKPNYPSIMNYMFVDRLAFNEAFWTLDYSRSDALTVLDEDNLNESVGIPSGGIYNNWIAPFGVLKDGDREVRYVHLDGRPTDFGNPATPDGEQDEAFDSGVQQDLNYLGDDIPVDGADEPTPSPAVLLPHDDWQNLVYILVDGSENPQPRRGGELTSEAVFWMDANFPDPPALCAADLDGDGDVGFTDLLAVLSSWGPCAGCPADLDGDDVVGFSDLLTLLSAWGPCP